MKKNYHQRPATSDQQRSKRRRRLGIVLILFLIAAYGGVAVLQWINVPAAQRHIAAWISQHTSWNITLDHFEWRFFANTLVVKNLTLHHQKTGNQLHADHILVQYSPWGLPMGRFKVRNLLMDQVIGDFSNMPPPSSRRKHINLRKLLILQNLTVQAATINGVEIGLPHARHLSTAVVRFQLLPARLTSGVQLNVQTESNELTDALTPVATLARLTFSGTTDVRRWVDTPPFVNGVKGALTVSGGEWKKIQVSELRSILSFDQGRFGMDDLHATINDALLQGHGHIDLEKETYAAELQWPKPMPVPELFGPNRFMDTAGTLEGRLALKGKGFDPAISSGEGSFDLTHVPAATTTIPAHLVGKATWTNGACTLKDTKLLLDNGVTTIQGGVDLGKRHINLQFHGEKIPALGVLGRFNDIHFHPVRGLAAVEGRFAGWGHNYALDIAADVTDVFYQSIAVERIHLKMHLTYPRLDFTGQIFQNGRATGQTDFYVAYGERIGDGPRPKRLHLQAKVEGHDLSPSFAALHLRGTGNGTLTIDGPPENYRGTGQAEIVNGALYDLPLKHVQSKLALVPRLITYTDGSIELPNTPPLLLPQPLKMTFIPDGFRLTGTPRIGTSLDMQYRTADGYWTIHSINYADPTFPDRRLAISGTGVSGNWNLGIRGTGNLALLEYLPGAVREASGPMTVDVRLTGPLDRPNLSGTAKVRDATLLLRTLPYHLEQLNGTLRFSGQEIRFDPLNGRIGDGTFTLTGAVRQAGFALTNYDVRLHGTNLHYASADRHFRAEVDGDIAWRGSPERSTITGDLTILDGKYDREFRVLEQVGRRGAAEAHAALRMVQEGWEHIGLDLRVRSTGDIWIRNNVADVALRADTNVTGSLARPQFRGAIETTEGKLHYLGLKFDITRGLVEFHAPFAHPYIEMAGEKEVREYLVQIALRGPVDNLALDLTATPGLEQKDILALLAFGATQEELRTAQFGAQIGPSIFLEQVGKLVERPLSKLTGLDVVRVETQTGSGGGTEGSRLYLGKRLSDRLAVEFVTGVSEQKSEQGFQVEYNLTDFLLLKAGQSSGEKAKFDFSLRFRER